MGLKFVLFGGGACPEQYDIFLGRERIGYARLRHGRFTVQYPDVGGEIFFDGRPKGDGEFWDDEREHFLRRAVMALSLRAAQDAELSIE